MSQLQKSITGLSPSLDSEVGRVVTETGLATSNEVEFCREHQKQASDPSQRSLADLLVEHSFITPTQARRIKSQLEERDDSQIPGYQLICRVGKGAMATVYKGRQKSLDRIVAIRVRRKKMTASAELAACFYKGARPPARLSHNNI